MACPSPRPLGQSAASAPRDPAAPAQLSRDDVRQDVQALERALELGFAPRIFVTRETWRSFHGELVRLAEYDHDPRSFCNALGSVLTRLMTPALYATMIDGSERCVGAGGATGGFPYVADRNGTSLAASAERPYSIWTEGGASGIAILAVRHFEPPSAPGWEGFALDAKRAAGAPALILDLRMAQGQDPSAVLPLVSMLAGGATIRPLRAIERADNSSADALRRAHVMASNGAQRVRSPEAWAALVGVEPPAPPPPASRLIRVLVGEGCEEACELVARSLRAYAGADVLGRVGSESRLAVGEPGLLVLPRSRVRVHLPTAAYVLNEHIARITGDGGAWFDHEGLRSWQGTPDAAPAYDALTTALAGVRQAIVQRARLARWASAEPRPCAAYPPVARPEDLSAQARARIQGVFERPTGVSITATFDLPMARALAYANGCPGITATHGFGDEAATVFLRVASFEALSRLAQSDAVQLIKIERERQYRPN